MICLALDTETTGKPTKDTMPDMVQIGWILFDDQDERVLGVFSTIVDSGSRVRSGAQGVHGISDSDVHRAGIPEKFVLAMLVGVAQVVQRIVAHNAQFDLGVIRHSREKHHCPDIWSKRTSIIDLMKDYEGVCRIEREGFEDFKWPSLDEVLKATGIDLERGQHSALSDAIFAMHAYLHLKRNNLIEEVD